MMDDTPRTKYEPLILRWNDDDVDEADKLHCHFRDLEKTGQLQDCWDVAEEGRRIWNRMFVDDVESGSASDSVFAAIAGSAYDLALRHVAKHLGVSLYAVKCALESEVQSDAGRFLDECKRRADERADY